MDVWDGLDECEISQPTFLSQSAPAYIHAYIDIQVFHSSSIDLARNGQIKGCFWNLRVCMSPWFYYVAMKNDGKTA